MRLKVAKTLPWATLPQYAHPDDSGLDLRAAESVELEPGGSRAIRTGLAIELPAGTEAQIRPRSGLALEHQIAVLNAPGTIDAGYRGEIRVILINHGRAPFGVTAGMKIAQMVVAPVLHPSIEAVERLSETARGSRGFGSSGN